MPTYQAARYLGAALEEVARQADDGVEVVVADDGSTDGTLELVARYQGALRLTLVHRGGDGAWPAGVNRALAEATGRHACLLFHDDLWLPGRLAAVKSRLARAPAAKLLVSPTRFVGPAGEPLGEWRTPFGRGDLTVPADRFVERLLVQNFLGAPAPVFDRAAALEVGGLDPALWYTADWDLWLRLAALGPVEHLGAPTAAFRIHADSMTLSRRRDAAEFRAQHLAVLERHAPLAPRPPAALRAARASVEVNVALAELARGARPPLAPLLGAAARLGPGGLLRYLRDSRLLDRVRARLRARRGGL
jgi:GT2 family glycosyltransferase